MSKGYVGVPSELNGFLGLKAERKVPSVLVDFPHTGEGCCVLVTFINVTFALLSVKRTVYIIDLGQKYRNDNYILACINDISLAIHRDKIKYVVKFIS